MNRAQHNHRARPDDNRRSVLVDYDAMRDLLIGQEGRINELERENAALRERLAARENHALA